MLDIHYKIILLIFTPAPKIESYDFLSLCCVGLTPVLISFGGKRDPEKIVVQKSHGEGGEAGP